MIRLYAFAIMIFLASCGSKSKLIEVKKLDAYPSASAIEYFHKQFYMIGDDARDLLILDSNFIPTDSIRLYSFIEKRIPRMVKADLEAITTTHDKKLLIVGSGALSPYRNVAWLIDPITKQKDSIRLDTFYQRLKPNGIGEINIEGVCIIPGSIILTNRGSKGYRKNHLLFTSEDFWKHQATAPISLVLAGYNTDSTLFNGVSGVTYAKKSDQLILTVSTEDTRNSIDNGAIGKSYLWMIKNISSKKKMEGC